MKRKAAFQYTIYIVVLIGLFVFLAGCGSDESAPSIDTSFIPQTVFFNDTGSMEYYLFQGRATDNINVATVLVSSDNGATWSAAEIDKDPPNKNSDVEWSYLASSADISAGMHTVLVRASDRDDNETTSGSVILESISSADPADLLALFSSAGAGDVIGLSTGAGFAFGDSVTALTIPINVDLTVQGSGYGNTITSGHPSFPAVMSTATILQSLVSSASIFSVDADLSLKNLRLLGAGNAVRISDSAGPDPRLSVEDCVFDGQGAWAVYAEDDDAAVSVDFMSSIVDASNADSLSGGGGLYLDNVSYTVTGSEFYFQSAAAPGAGVQILSGTGNISNSFFGGNALAIWAHNGSQQISSCNITGSVSSTSNGVLFTGNVFGTSNMIHNRISENMGYGVMISGDAPVIFEQNSIFLNSSGGVVLDYNFSSISKSPILGDCQAYNICDEGGRNSIFSNLPYDAIATANTDGADVILAQGNYWGPTKVSDAHVDQVIKDGDTLLTTLRVPPLTPDLGEDSPNAWAKLNFLPFNATGNDPND
ncbi:MAG: hypothetical protein RRA15_11540 [bacterium]|nr:hypothetical protein [bacterium]MDT8367098.1 hypothetical protein [bacterium]